jgi:peptidoglycan/LPS O-acetylase OafA/YrhL
MASTRSKTRVGPWTPPLARPGADRSQAWTRPREHPREHPRERPRERPWERPSEGAGEAFGKRYRPGLDGLRAVAIAGVLLYHAGFRWMPGGLLGVDLFFVISGFLITSLLVGELQRTGGIALVSFYGRRARRLLPALAVVLVVTTAGIALLSPHELARFRGDLVASLGYVTNWWFIVRHESYFVAAGRPSPFQHLWSLAVEEQFYLLWPLGLLALWRSLTGSGRLLRVAAVALLGAVLSAGWMAVLAVHHHLPYGADSSRVYFGTDTHASALLVGVAAAALLAGTRGVLWQFRPPRESAAVDATGGVALLAVCWAMMRTSEFSPALYRGGFFLFAVVAAVAVVAASRPGSMLESALGSKPLRWVGTRSYGLYLWHWPLFVYTRPQLDLPLTGAADAMLRLALTAALAEASYRLVERPIRTMGMRVWLDAALLRGTEVAAMVRSAAAGPCSRLPRLAARAAGSATRAVRAAPPWQPALTAWILASILFTVGFLSYRWDNARAALHPPAATSRQVSHVDEGPTPAGTPSAGATPAPNPSPAPPDAAGPGGKNVTAVGDSVMLGAVGALKEALPGASINAAEGRQASEAFALLDTLVTQGHIGGEVILHIGTNGTIDPGALDAMLARLAGRRVIMLDVHVPRPWQDLNNRILIEAARAHPKVRLVDWNAAATAHPEWLWDDGIHLRPGGAAAYRALVVATLG